MVRRMISIVMAGAVALAVIPAAAQAQSASPHNQCFYPNEWSGWKASPDSKSIYLRVGINRIYRLDLAGACEELQMPDARLITKIRGSDTFCNALDFDLSVSSPPGIPIPCIVSKMTELTPDEAAALPKKLRP